MSCLQIPVGSLPAFPSFELSNSASRLASPLRDRCLSDFVSSPDLIRSGAVDILWSTCLAKSSGVKASPTALWHLSHCTLLLTRARYEHRRPGVTVWYRACSACVLLRSPLLTFLRTPPRRFHPALNSPALKMQLLCRWQRSFEQRMKAALQEDSTNCEIKLRVDGASCRCVACTTGA